MEGPCAVEMRLPRDGAVPRHAANHVALGFACTHTQTQAHTCRHKHIHPSFCVQAIHLFINYSKAVPA